jgi:anti-sigma regulatory factor (Ser/Thr protein kinase)
MREGWSTAPEEVRVMGFGAGMGLPNMKRNADDFSIQSEVGKGTEIVMKFALAPVR